MLKIKELREEKRLSQDDMVARTGIPKRSYINYEHEKTDIPLSKLQNIAIALGVEIQDLIKSNEGENVLREPEEHFKRQGFSELAVVRMHEDLKNDLKTIYDGLNINFKTISTGVLEVLKDTKRITGFIDELNPTEIKEAGQELTRFLEERK